MSDPALIREIDQLKRQFKALQTRDKTQVASGTFTPTYFGSTTAGVTTYTTQYGRYTRIADMCYIWLRLDWTAVTGTGNGLVGGLPFVAATNAQVSFSIMSQNHGYTNAGLRAYIFGGNQVINLFDQVVGAFANAAIDAAATLIISGAYPV